MPQSTRRHLLLLAGFGTAATATVAAAHHGWAEYGSADFSFDGRIETANLGNPHGLIRARDDQQRLWDIVLGPPSNQRRAGLTDAAVPPGATIQARGHRHRDPNKLEMKTERLIVGGRTYDIYPNRG